ncbi:MAG: hypothetical protein ACFCVA_08660 [Gammaproteobacteria bacterium]
MRQTVRNAFEPIVQHAPSEDFNPPVDGVRNELPAEASLERSLFLNARVEVSPAGFEFPLNRLSPGDAAEGMALALQAHGERWS